MRIIEQTQTRLVAAERHRAARGVAIGLAVVLGAVGLYQAALGSLLAGLALAALALAGSVSLCRLLGPVQAVFDRAAGTLHIQRQCFYGTRSETHPLPTIRGVEIADRLTDDRRPQRVVALTEAPEGIALTGPYSNSATHESVVAEINAWLDSGSARA